MEEHALNSVWENQHYRVHPGRGHTRHQQKDFEKNDGEWSEKLENRKKKKKEKEKNGGKWGVCVGVGVGGELLAVGEACVSIFGPIPGLKGKHSSPLGDLNFWGS